MEEKEKAGQGLTVQQMQSENKELREEVAKLGREKRDLAMMLTEAEVKVKCLKDWSAKVKDYLRKVLNSYSVLKEQT